MKKILPILILVLALAGGAYVFIKPQFSSQTSSVNQDASSTTPKAEISASGSVASQNQATLYFQVGGKLTSLPFQVGDSVKQGDIIAALDATDALHQETAAEASYRSAQAALNLVLDNIHLSQYGNGGFSNVGSSNETQTQTTQRQQAQEAVNSSYDNLQVAKQNLSLYSLVAPFDGLLTQESVTSPGVNISSVTSGSTTFTVSDPSKAVFQALVSSSDLGLIKEGSSTTVILDSAKERKFSGSVIKIYPDKTTSSSGESVYKVDISIPEILSYAKFGSTGTALISTTNSQTVTQVPTWTILNNQYVWVMAGNTPVLKKVVIGSSGGGLTEIISGLSDGDKVITDPKSLVVKEYKIL